MLLNANELRLLGCLIEKEMTTPEYYPLSFNALRTACNQTSNRDPVVTFEEDAVAEGVASLRSRGLAKQVRIPGQRAEKIRHAAGDMLPVTLPQLSLLAVLMLRGPQTIGELRQRTERYHHFDSLVAVEEDLTRMAGLDDPLVRRLDRRPGQKEARYIHLLGETQPEERVEAAAKSAELPAAIREQEPDLADDVAGLRSELEALRAEVAELRDRLGL